jgi:hypothetical protein
MIDIRCFSYTIISPIKCNNHDWPPNPCNALKDESLAINDMPQSSYQSLETVNGGWEDDDPMLEDVDSRKAL